ncbi:uncharacterized protein J8A68_003227 [[Candida] subhashii]|uniref:Uncharacterized protein n=1 Tax=[Candida] subhashii TaxID=561895 RepID=A0A8J5UMP9_9ASCO|nr:uncharacterized protein J8A68_003227 [[Candida] subhashii]KAG7663227.1 hypothetical protein J8A68_003227 [[Candida] subhashii]
MVREPYYTSYNHSTSLNQIQNENILAIIPLDLPETGMSVNNAPVFDYDANKSRRNSIEPYYRKKNRHLPPLIISEYIDSDENAIISDSEDDDEEMLYKTNIIPAPSSLSFRTRLVSDNYEDIESDYEAEIVVDDCYVDSFSKLIKPTRLSSTIQKCQPPEFGNFEEVNQSLVFKSNNPNTLTNSRCRILSNELIPPPIFNNSNSNNNFIDDKFDIESTSLSIRDDYTNNNSKCRLSLV